MIRPYLINIFKPAGMTSYQVVRHFKQVLPPPFGKIGHLGTLDPFAEGVLLIASGGAQRMNNFIHQWYPKSYLAEGILGVQTPSGDMTEAPSWHDHSQRLEQLSVQSPDFYRQHWKSFSGEYWQTPPAFSACKFKGRPLHVWAREGVAILKDPVKRVIGQMSIIKVDFPRVIFSVTVSSGTYIRGLFEDMAKKLGTCGALTGLKRVAIGPFHADKALLPEQWPSCPGEWKWRVEDQLHSRILLSKVWLNSQGTARYRYGHVVDESMVDQITPGALSKGEDGPFWAISHNDGELLGMALGERRCQHFCLRPKVTFPHSF